MPISEKCKKECFVSDFGKMFGFVEAFHIFASKLNPKKCNLTLRQFAERLKSFLINSLNQHFHIPPLECTCWTCMFNSGHCWIFFYWDPEFFRGIFPNFLELKLICLVKIQAIPTLPLFPNFDSGWNLKSKNLMSWYFLNL